MVLDLMRYLLFCLFLLGCNSATGPTQAGSDAGADSGVDGPDASHEAGSDAGSDAGTDAAVPAGIHAGAVTTWLADSGAGDDLTWHPDGYLVASDPKGTGATPDGKRLLRIDLDGTVSTISEGLRKPLGNAVAPDGTLYACEWGSPLGSVFKVTPAGDVSEVAVDISYPSNLVVHSDGSLWVSAWGTNQVLRVVEGQPPTEVAVLNGPVAMEHDVDGQVIVASANSGDVWHLSDQGEATLLGHVVESGSIVVGDVTPAHGGIYATSFGGHRIWRIADGQATVFAGTGAQGTEDGPGATATFDEPDGIAASPDGRTLYVQQFGGALRTIAIEGD
jgi:sugar lactone lactonase YvrE